MNTGLPAIAPVRLPTRLRALVSVRDVAEALQAAAAGVDTIDLKDPSDGALGGLPLGVIADIVAALRARTPSASISATVGDWPAAACAAIQRRVERVAACGVDQVKVGIPMHDPAAARDLLDALAGQARASGIAIVPVLIADDGLAPACVDAAAAGGFPAVMLDTADKRGGSLLQRRPAGELAAWVTALRRGGGQVGLAGALMPSDLPALRALAPDYAGFRSAVCAGDRRLGLDPDRLAALLAALG
ncbi:(5-formylfuran-3-yl)methyl phosphate synthase [Leptothrix discophora]|uniref:(5-formylfuran-3-yl)methyl phosphate synthase n=1 Tax=Leptothrix discophora TaxID=89 RepID=A0ABT9G8D0_LEPDI|nr:(5-formylfuran-3-yl)methyl phosphate synthase [Leptothrix discophora]MDP4302744.1 (5-formylfuran-3-yl)methyl phosphate synthase [Leptothrix discophora]